MDIDSAALMTALDERRHALGQLRSEGSGDARPLTWVEVAAQVGTHSATFSRLKAGRAPGEATYLRLASWLGVDPERFCSGCNAADGPCEDCQSGQGPDATDPDGGAFTLVGDEGLPVAERDHEWDGSGATARVFERFTDEDGNVDVDGVSRAFLWRDPDAEPDTQAAYSLGFADVIDDELRIVPHGLAATAGGRGVDAVEGISDDDRDRIETRICSLYEVVREAYDDWPECPFADEEAVAAAADQSGEDAMAAIYGWGSLSDSESEEVQAKVARVAELIAEGAVGVSIMHDLDPDDMPDQETIDALIEAEDWDGLDALFADVHARPRHVAIVDTPAFSDARLTLGEDGLSVEGPVTFEGTWTGDMRMLPYGVLTWDDDLLPIPIVIDHDGGSNEVVGYIDRLERQDGVSASLRPAGPSEEQVHAVAAAAGGDIASALPAAYFAQFRATKAEPLHIDAPDARGLRRVWGHAAPRGVCHRSDMGACFTYPGDVDKELRGFHTGAVVALDDGTTLRPGALTLGDLHLDTGLARRGVGAREVNRHREDGNEVFAMVRAWGDRHGLAISGVVLPGVSDEQVLRALSLAPSVELWPERGGRTLVGLHLVPTPAWPVAASAGSALSLTLADRVEGGEADGDASAADGETFAAELVGEPFDLSPVTDSLARVEKALAMLVADRLTDVPIANDPESANE